SIDDQVRAGHRHERRSLGCGLYFYAERPGLTGTWSPPEFCPCFSYFFLPGPRDAFGGGGAVRKRYHCCPMPIILLESICNAKPLGERANMPPKIKGVMAIIF